MKFLAVCLLLALSAIISSSHAAPLEPLEPLPLELDSPLTLLEVDTEVAPQDDVQGERVVRGLGLGGFGGKFGGGGFGGLGGLGGLKGFGGLGGLGHGFGGGFGGHGFGGGLGGFKGLFNKF